MTNLELVGEFRAKGVDLSLGEAGQLLYKASKGTISPELMQRLKSNRLEILRELLVEEDDDKLDKTKDLTELQGAYWFGELHAPFMRTPAYIHKEFITPAIDIERFKRAVHKLCQLHPELTVKVTEEGAHARSTAAAEFEVEYEDIRHLEVNQQVSTLSAKRQTVPSGLPPLAAGPQFSCVVIQSSEGVHLHFVLRLMVFDARSLDVFFNDLVALYLGSNGRVTVPKRSFRGYRRMLRDGRNADAKANAMKYWAERELPPPPPLPRAGGGLLPTRSSFRRLTFKLDNLIMKQLEDTAKGDGISLNVLLCTAYADVLRRWSGADRFTLNLLLSDRAAENSSYGNVVGNFGKTLLLEVQFAPSETFAKRAKKLQERLYADIAYGSAVSGIEVARVNEALQNNPVPTPIVFASGLGASSTENVLAPSAAGWKCCHSAMHTPQVWLDHQVYLEEGELILNWEVAAGVFPEGLVEVMFEAYRAHVLNLASYAGPTASIEPIALPIDELAARAQANRTGHRFKEEILHEGFERACEKFPHNIAIASDNRTLTYDELWRYTTNFAARLRDGGAGRNKLIGVVARKSWRQVAAVMSVIQSGSGYLPIETTLPSIRRNEIIRSSGLVALVVERSLFPSFLDLDQIQVYIIEDELPEDAPKAGVALPQLQLPEDLAYVIYTSGSSGKPKGVAIDHRGASNTLSDVIRRFGLDASDRVLALSSFSFDLSVYDVFATLRVGAAIVVPTSATTPTPEDWANCSERFGVTVWNSVPALLEMFIEFLDDSASRVLRGLRLVLLSGDWIPLQLPARLSNINDSTRIIALGGATEASIWSNFYDIRSVSSEWISIPYGRPLANQHFHILDNELQPSPTWVPGHLYIGGRGLAVGYHNDPSRTSISFITNPETGDRLYHTGDLARYWKDGTVEFLGRVDTQVKIRGYRVELGEIEHALEIHPSVRTAVVIAKRDSQSDSRLVAFLTFLGEQPPKATEVSEFVRRSLPDYMVPGAFFFESELPLTTNGKVDRAALSKRTFEEIFEQTSAKKQEPRNDFEAKIKKVWLNVISSSNFGIHDNFFDLGGTSLSVVRLLTGIEKELGVRLQMAELFRNGTIAEQAALVDLASVAGKSLARDPLVPIRDGASTCVIAVHPVGGNVLCYRELAQELHAELGFYALQSPGDCSERSVEQLAEQYVQCLKNSIPGKRFILLGWSMGGTIAQEMARQMEASVLAVDSVVMIDSWGPAHKYIAELSAFDALTGFCNDLWQGIPNARPPSFETQDFSEEKLNDALEELGRSGHIPGELSKEEIRQLFGEYLQNYKALLAHPVLPTSTPIRAYMATQSRSENFHHLKPIDEHVLDSYGTSPENIVHRMKTGHFSIISRPQVQLIAEQENKRYNAMTQQQITDHCL